MKRTIDNALITLVQTLNDGIEFYRIAQQKTRSEQLHDVFASMADTREFALAYIRPYMDQHDFDLQKSLTYHGTLANRYAPLLQNILLDQQLTLVQQVEEHLIDAMITASMTTHNALVQCILHDLAPQISRNFDAAVQLTHHQGESSVAA